ncbi:MAG: hemolysin III family protein [Bacteroidaceae bacterium]|nr:hemolysin III family protein [Bacteroidaceae bacterium]
MTLNGNFWTHLAGTVFAVFALWIAWPAAALGWQWSMGVALFLTGMFLMFTSSTVYHAAPPGRTKDLLRKLDHINIYVMIACSYSPILLGVVGGALGWGVFVLMWLVTLGGAISKIVAIGRYPRLSLAVYLIMGWSVVFIARPVWQRLGLLPLSLILAEGLFYTAGTYFYAYDERPHYHAIWHIFVLLGAIAHWGAVTAIIYQYLQG